MPVPLVLLPGMNCSARLWDGVVDELGRAPAGATDVMVEALDRPSVDEQVQALLARWPGRFAIGGLSLGAIVAMAVHRSAPDRVAGLLLVATNARPPTEAQRVAWDDQLARLVAGTTARDLQEELLPFLLGPDAGPPWRRTALEMAEEVGTARLHAQLQLQASRVDERPGLRGVEVPTLVVAAGRDAICPMERHVEIHSLTPGSELVTVPEAPHLVTLTHAEAVAGPVAGWLRRVRA